MRASAGVRDVKKLRANEAMGEMGKASAALDDDEVLAATEVARDKYGAQARATRPYP